MQDTARYTLDQLTELVDDALAVDYPGAPTGRVRDVPDQRVIRWYVTRGLVDRPVASRGRTALYGRRHLLQLVAIKRRQADGRSLAEIQAELAGATDDVLAGVARLPSTAEQLAAEHRSTVTEPGGDGGPDVPIAAGPARARFWATDRPAASGKRPRDTMEPVVAHAVAGLAAVPVTTGPAEAGTGAGAQEAAWPGDGRAMHAVRLAPGVILLIEGGAPATAGAATIRAAARPLLDLLAGRPVGAEPRPGHAARRQP